MAKLQLTAWLEDGLCKNYPVGFNGKTIKHVK